MLLVCFLLLLQHRLLELDRALQAGEQQLELLKSSNSSPAPPYIRSLIDSLEAELNRLSITHSTHTALAERLCGDAVSEGELVRWSAELYDSERRSHEICWLELDERRHKHRPHTARPHNNGTASLKAATNAKKRQRTETKQWQSSQHLPLASSPLPLSAFQLPPLAHFAFPAAMIESLSGRPIVCNKLSSALTSPALSTTSSPVTSDVDVEEMADEADSDNESDSSDIEIDGDEAALSPPSHPYNTSFLLPPLPSLAERRSTLTTLLTFTHPLPSSHYSLHCMPIPQPYVPPSSWPPLARQAYTLLLEMNHDGGRGSSSGYYLLLVDAATSVLVSASYLVLSAEHGGRHTLAVNCFCTRRESQRRGCGRVLYEAIRELRCRLSQWLLLTRLGSSGCQLIVHTVPATELMWQSIFGLTRTKSGWGSGGYPNTTPLIDLIDGRRDTQDRRREWLERIEHWTAPLQNGRGSKPSKAASTRVTSERTVAHQRTVNGHGLNGCTTMLSN